MPRLAHQLGEVGAVVGTGGKQPASQRVPGEFVWVQPGARGGLLDQPHHRLVGQLFPRDLANLGHRAERRTPDADERVLEPLAAAGKNVVIPPKANRRERRRFDRDMYKSRHLIENFFARLKQYRTIATRYDKTGRTFLAAIHLAASVIWLA